MSDWTKPSGYMHVGRIGPVEIMTPKEESGLKRGIIRAAVPTSVWLKLLRGLPPA